MKRHCRTLLNLAFLALLSSAASAQIPYAGVERALGLSAARDSGIEVRVWLGGSLRVSTVYRIVKTAEGASAEKFAWTEVKHAAPGLHTEAEARRETKMNRQYLQEERCAGRVVETADYLWCKVALNNEYAPVLFDDLLPDELRTLPPEADRSCKSLIVLDGEAVRIDVLEPGRRHTVTYWNPETCCRTVACAIVDHVRTVVRNIH